MNTILKIAGNAFDALGTRRRAAAGMKRSMTPFLSIILMISLFVPVIPGDMYRVAEASGGTGLLAAIGTYSGNNQDSRTITIPNVSWTPKFIMIKSNWNEAAMFWMEGMASGFSYNGTSLEADSIKSSGPGTFTVNSSYFVNAIGTDYRYIALGSIDGAHVQTGSYAGDGTSGRAVPIGGGWGTSLPDHVFVKRSNTSKMVWKSSTHSAAGSQFLDVAQNETYITGFGAGSFTVGSDASVNENGGAYNFVAIRDYDKVLKTVQYTGNATAGRLINDLGFTPDAFAFIKLRPGSNSPALRFASHDAGEGQVVNAVPSAGNIQNFISGGIQIGNGINVNNNGSVYHGFLVSERLSAIEYIVDDEVMACGAVITEPGEYVLGANLTAEEDETCIRIEADDVSLDGNGYSMTGDEGSKGVEVYEADNAAISNMNISGFEYGVYSYEAINALVENSTIAVTENGGAGIFMDFSVSFELKNNVIDSVGNGIKVNEHVTLMGAKKITGNGIESDDWALYLDSAGVEALGNAFKSDKWVYNNASGNAFDNGTSGNKYYFANGSGAWTQFDIKDSNNDNWADEGDDLPFSEATLGELHWFGAGQDAHPWTEVDVSAPAGSGQNSGVAASGGPVAVSSTVYCTNALTTFCSPQVPSLAAPGQALSSLVPAAAPLACGPGHVFDVRTGLRCGATSSFGLATGQAASFSFAFTQDLSLGKVHPEVKLLQQYLNANGFAIARSGPGSIGNETTMFGSLTRSALARFQQAKGIVPAAGYFGPVTRTFVSR